MMNEHLLSTPVGSRGQVETAGATPTVHVSNSCGAVKQRTHSHYTPYYQNPYVVKLVSCWHTTAFPTNAPLQAKS